MANDPVQRNAISIGVATAIYAVSFGVLSVAAGFSVAQTCVMSLVAFTGASQFTFVSVLGAGGSVAGALPPALLLAARNGVYALSLAEVLRGTRLARAFLAVFVVDETTAMAQAQRTPAAKRRAFNLTAISLYVGWNAGTLVGAVVGKGIGNPRDFGIEAIFPAVFLALLAPQLQRPRAPQAALAGAIVAACLIPITPVGVPVMASALVAVPLLLDARRRSRGGR